jgi:hypothetical protein
MDFTWITNDVGDITAVTAGTGITGGGTSGAVTVSFDQANFGGGQNAAGKNEVLNSNFSVWQRGTSFSVAAGTSAVYLADRWGTGTGTNQASTFSRQLTNDTTNLPNIQYCLRYQRNSGQTGTGGMNLIQSFETVNSIPLAGRSVTLSFYARAGANYSPTSSALPFLLITGTGTDQSRLTGGYTGEAYPISSTATLTTTWQRFTATGTVAANVTEMALYFNYTPTGTAGANDYYEITGIQLEAASTASPYAPNTTTYQAELAACQRYYYRTGGSQNYEPLGIGIGVTTTTADIVFFHLVEMRVAPTSLDYATLVTFDGTNTSAVTLANISANGSGKRATRVTATVGSGLVQYRPVEIITNNSTAGYVGFSAEL